MEMQVVLLWAIFLRVLRRFGATRRGARRPQQREV
jgi:hypothetical protein